MLKVNRSKFYKYNNRKPSARFLENIELKWLILQIYTEINYRLDAAKIQIFYNVNRVFQLVSAECTV